MDLNFESFKETLLADDRPPCPDETEPRLWDQTRLDAESALALKNIFFFLGLVFRYPTERIYSEIEGHIDVFSDFLKNYGGAVPTLPPIDDLQPEYIGLFVTNQGFVPASPYASCYQGDGLLMGDSFFRLRQIMSASGFMVDASVRELEDHLAVMLEFCSVILGRLVDRHKLPGNNAAADVYALMEISYRYIRPMIELFTQRINAYAHFDIYKVTGNALQELFREADTIYDQLLGFRKNSIND